MTPEIEAAAQIVVIQIVFAAVVVWLDRWRADRALQADLATPGQPEEHRALDFGPFDEVHLVEPFVTADDLEAIDDLLAEGAVDQARRDLQRLVELLQGHDEAALADARYLAHVARPAA